MAGKAGISVRKVRRGSRFEFPGEPQFSIDLLHPSPSEPLPFARSPNDTSLALRFSFRGSRILFLGDVEEDGLARLFEEESDLHADVLIAPHHGRANKLWNVLLEKVRPAALIVSGSGDGGAREVARNAESAGISVHATWIGGAVRTVWTRGKGWKPGYWRK